MSTHPTETNPTATHPTEATTAIPPQMPPQLAPQQIMMQMLTGCWLTQCLYVAAKLGIADHLKAGALSCEQLAEGTQCHAPSLYRVMRALASLGIFAETTPQCFELTPLAALLQTQRPDSMRDIAMMLGEEHYVAWGALLHSVRTGESGFEHTYEMDVFTYYRQTPDSAAIFDGAMSNFSAIENAAVVAAYDFTGLTHIVDVGGGQGSLVASILKQNPGLKGTVFDQGYVQNAAQKLFAEAGLADRSAFVSGDFFTSVPAQGDAYLLKHIIHDWDDERSIVILKQCHQAMADNGRLLIVEQVIPPGNTPFVGKLLDVNMLAMCPGGKERTAAEYATLLTQAGFELTQIVPTQGDVSIVEGHKR
jgi:O-methyltransferase domain/Dimerisation domain